MTTHSLQPGRPHVSVRTAGLGLAGAGLVVAAAFASGLWETDDGPPTAPGEDVSSPVDPSGVRDSWEGRIGPDADPRPAPGQQRLKLEQLR